MRSPSSSRAAFVAVWTAVCAALLACPARADAPISSAAPQDEQPPAAEWDLLELSATERTSDPSLRVTAVTNFDEQRRVVATAIPARLAHRAHIPAGAFLEFGYSMQARMFGVDLLAKAGPTRFRVELRENSGTRHVLHERVIEPRDRIADRRWFDERIDLGPHAGTTGTMVFSVERADDPAAGAETTALLSSPRIVRRARPDDVNVLFVTVDCLRADHVGAYGYERPTTPAIDRVAAEGVRFARAYANAPMTIPSLPQIFTSAVFPRPGMPTFVEPFAEAGIPNAAIVNNVWLVLWMSRASVPFDTVLSGDLQADRITDRALKWLDGHARSRFALYLHYLDAHTPYRGPAQYARLFADPAYRGPIGDAFGDVVGANAGRLTDADKARVVALYDGHVRFIDDQIARVLDRLRELELLDRTLVVISADHGEELWDHGHFFHGQSLFDELLHVPLVVRLPGARHAGMVVDRMVRSIDVAPSLVAWAGLERPSSFEGRPLAEAIANPDAPADPVVATATMGQFPNRYGVRTSDWKLVETIDSGRRQLFDLTADPGETVDAQSDRSDVGAALQAEIDGKRRAIAADGLQIRIVGPRSGAVPFRLKLRHRTRNGVFETVDRVSAPPGTRVGLSSDGREIAIRGQADAQGSTFRADRRLLLLAALAAKADPIRVDVRIDGGRPSGDPVLLGSGQPVGPLRVFEFSDAALEATAPPRCDPPERGVRVCLWRRPEAVPEPSPVAPPVADDSARDRLRALGYVQ